MIPDQLSNEERRRRFLADTIQLALEIAADPLSDSDDERDFAELRVSMLESSDSRRSQKQGSLSAPQRSSPSFLNAQVALLLSASAERTTSSLLKQEGSSQGRKD